MKREYSVIKVGIVGLGNIGKKRLSALKKIKKYKIVISFIIDKNEINNKKLRHIPFFTDFNKIKNTDADLIILSTPTKITEKILKKFSGKFNFLVEKPISNNILLLKKFIRESNKHNKILKVGYNLRFDRGLNNLKNKIKLVGEIYFVKITYANGTALTNTNKVGSVLDMATHSINLLEWLLNSSNLILKSNFEQKNEFLNKKKTDNGFIILRNKNTIINIHHSFCNWKNHFNLEISGSKGYLICNSLTKWGNQEIILGKRKYPSGKPHEKKKIFKNDYSWINEILYTINIIKNNYKNLTKINIESLNTLKIIKKII